MLAAMSRDPVFLAECVALIHTVTRFPTYIELRKSREWPHLEPRFGRLLSTIRLHEPGHPPSPPRKAETIRAVQWNIEHGNCYEQVEQALLEHPELRDADLVTLNEVDLGMARSGNRDVAADLCRSLGLFGAWAPLFLETTLGRHDDSVLAAGGENQESLFGLALLSRWPIKEVRLVVLPSPEMYQFDVERMIGRHIALVALIERPQAPFVAVSVHLEVHRTRVHRAAQMRALVAALHEETLPVVIAGHFNSHSFDRGRRWDPWFGAQVLALSPTAALSRRLLYPDRGANREWLFDELSRAGFEWERFVDRTPTLQLRFDRLDELHRMLPPVRSLVWTTLAWAERRAQLRLDWFAGRQWQGGRGFTVAGLSGPGQPSDHAPIVAEFE